MTVASDFTGELQDYADETPSLSVVIPTRNEAGNIAALLDRLSAVSVGDGVELIFVDDSDDLTPESIEQRRQACPHSIVVHHRPEGERLGGLGGAVAEGLKRARGEWIAVMDADLQHPPELLTELVDRAVEEDLDLV